MEKKLIQEINQIRSMMGLSLINEAPGAAGVVDDLIKKMLQVAGKSFDEEIAIGVGKSAKKIKWGELASHIRNYKTLTADNKKLVQDFLKSKAGKSWYKNYKSEVSKITNATQKGMHNRIINKIESDMPSLVGGSVSGTQSAAAGKASTAGSITNKLNSTADNAAIASGKKGLQDLYSIAKEYKNQFPEAFKSKDADAALRNGVKELEGKSFNEARQWIESRLKTIQDNIGKLPPKERKTFSDYAKMIIGYKTHMGDLDVMGSVKGVAGRVVGVAALTGWLYSAYESSVQNPEMSTLGNLTSGAFDQLGQILGGAVQGGKKGFETVKKEVETPAPAPVVTPPGGDTNPANPANPANPEKPNKPDKPSGGEEKPSEPKQDDYRSDDSY